MHDSFIKAGLQFHGRRSWVLHPSLSDVVWGSVRLECQWPCKSGATGKALQDRGMMRMTSQVMATAAATALQVRAGQRQLYT